MSERPREEQVWVSGRYAMLIRGEIKIEDLDDEEVAQGRLKDKNGKFSGRPPKMLPQELVTAMKREWLTRAENRLRDALLEHGIGTLVSLAKDDRIDPAVRLRAADKLIERTMGKVPDRVHIAAEDPVETLFRQILNDPEGLLQKDPPPKELSAEERAMLS